MIFSKVHDKTEIPFYVPFSYPPYFPIYECSAMQSMKLNVRVHRISGRYVMRSGVVPDIILIRFRFLCPQSSFALVQFLLLFYSLRGFLFYFL